VSQPGAFYRHEKLKAAGAWDESFHMTMDLDLWIRMARHSPPVMKDEPWAVFRHHGAQKTNGKNYIRQAHEIDRILRREGGSVLNRLFLYSRSHIWYLQFVNPLLKKRRPL
jgi:hypothetical protein